MSRPWRWTFAVAAAAAAATAVVWLQPRALGVPLMDAGRPMPRTAELWLPNQIGSVKFAVMGDVGRGDDRQYETGAEMARWHARFPFDTVLMLGDNIYGSGTAEDYVRRFEHPYAALIERSVSFRAVRGNHDPPGVEFYEPFGMDGHRYYTFTKTAGPAWSPRRVQFFALDTVHLDARQIAWFDEQLRDSRAAWKIAFFHHPLYTSGDYRWRAAYMRVRLEALLIDGGIAAVFSGHEHFYERVRPQHGVRYFTSGSGGALRPGALVPTALTTTGFDADTSFILVEILGDLLWFQVVTRTGATVDYGEVDRATTAGVDR
jgi:hypothetical protein